MGCIRPRVPLFPDGLTENPAAGKPLNKEQLVLVVDGKPELGSDDEHS